MTAPPNKKDQQPPAVVQEIKKSTAPEKKIQQPQVAATKLSGAMGLDTEMKIQPATTALENINACPNKSSSVNSHKQVPELEKTGRRPAAVPYLEKTGVRSSPRLAKRVRSNDDQVGAHL